MQPLFEEYLPLNPPIPVPNPQGTVSHQRRISFRHPAYPSTGPALLSLLAVDGGIGGGIHYHTAIVACGIVAGNRFQDAWFGRKDNNNNNNNGSGDAASFERCDEPLDGILRDNEYYFFVSTNGSRDEKYPVVPSFDHWRFPHNAIPGIWAELKTTLRPTNAVDPDPTSQLWRERVLARDRSCRVTGYREGLNPTHLVPRERGIWFMDNKMEQYCEQLESVLSVDDPSNALLLRADLHFHFDRRRIAFVPKKPKRDSVGALAPQLVVHQMLGTNSRELHTLYHNHALQPQTRGITIQSLLARFAWTVLCDENYRFLKGSQGYAITLWEPEKAETIFTTLNQQAIAKLGRVFPPPACKSRSVSPHKRKQDEREMESDSEPDWQVGSQHSDHIDDEDYEERRGRSKIRRYCGNEFHQPRDSLSTISPSSLETPSDNVSFWDSGQRKGNVESVNKSMPGKRRRLEVETLFDIRSI